MHPVDLGIFIAYMLLMLAIGWYFHRRNKGHDDYFAGGRNMKSWHVGLSVVATDVGGGFSIGLGGLGYMIGLSGSWILFTGLLGAWMSAVFLIPVVHRTGAMNHLLSFPQWLKHGYNKQVAFLAGLISAIGYLGFTSSQLLAGAKLASGVFTELELSSALLIMGGIAVVYTALGGLKAVIYTDTVQWIILLGGLLFVGVPLGYHAIGGWEGIQASVPAHFLQLNNIGVIDLINWGVTIIPIWFIGMTLYQRIYALPDVRSAKKAWFIAGIFEYPVMAFLGVTLGLFSKIAAEQGLLAGVIGPDHSQLDAEMGLPVFLRTILPVGGMGLLLSAYFSAILSTADSCLVAASGNMIHDLLPDRKPFNSLGFGQLLTGLTGMIAIVLALQMTSVLDLMLYSYAFMVGGLFIPVIGLLVFSKPNPKAALWAMVTGGVVTTAGAASGVPIPWQLDPVIPGILASSMLFLSIQKFGKQAYGIS